MKAALNIKTNINDPTMELNDKIIIYKTADGQTSVDVRMDGDTVWLSQAQMAELFQKDRTVISRHINNIFKEENLTKAWYVQILHTPRIMADVKVSRKPRM